MPEVTITLKTIDESSKQTEKVKKNFESLAPGIEKAGQSIGDFASKNATLIAGLVAVGVAIRGVLKDHIEYANSVRQLSALSGENTEETSRFIQVLDDYKISTDDALAATRALTKEGHAPSIETLAMLSDEYLSLNTVEEKNAFILKNLGRGGAAWTEVLQKGSKALREQGAAIDKNLILTQKMVDEAREAEVATDGWNDTIGALKTQFAVGLLPALTDYLNKVRAAIDSVKENGYWTTVFHPSLRKEALARLEAADAAIVHTDALNTNTTSLKENEEQIKLQEEAAKKLSDALSNQIGLINDIQSAEDRYTKESKDLADQRADKEAEVAKLRAQGYYEYGEDIQGALSDLDEIKRAEADLAKEREKQTLQFISDMLAQNLARDGWTQAEFDAFAKQQQAWGLWSADVVSKAQAAWKEADRVTASINAIPTSKVSTITVITNQATGMNIGTTTGMGGSGSIRNAGRPHATGGQFMIPMSYGNEGFRMGNGDTASGGETVTITPRGQTPQQAPPIDYKKMARVLRDTLAQAGT